MLQFAILGTELSRLGNCLVVEDSCGHRYWLKIQKWDAPSSPSRYRGLWSIYRYDTFEYLDSAVTDFTDWDTQLKRMLDGQLTVSRSQYEI